MRRVGIRLAIGLCIALVVVASALFMIRQEARIASLDRSVMELGASLDSLAAEFSTGLAEVASTSASSASHLAADVAASSREQAAALKSQGSELQDAVAAVTPAVVSIVERDTSGNKLSTATGFFVRRSGYIVTNKHVVDGTGSYSVVLASGVEESAAVIWRSPDKDLALIKVAGSGYPSVTLGDSGALVLGTSVFAIGNALGKFNNSVSVGVVSGLNRSITAWNDSTGQYENLSGIIQTDAAINPGNSGGPLATLGGKVVGVGVANVKGSQSIGFALPVSEVKAALAQLGI